MGSKWQYDISDTATTVALLSLEFNLMLTGVFIMAVKRLISTGKRERPERETLWREERRPGLDTGARGGFRSRWTRGHTE